MVGYSRGKSWIPIMKAGGFMMGLDVTYEIQIAPGLYHLNGAEGMSLLKMRCRIGKNVVRKETDRFIEKAGM